MDSIIEKYDLPKLTQEEREKPIQSYTQNNPIFYYLNKDILESERGILNKSAREQA